MKVLFICHDAGRTGAPIGLLAFMEWLHKNRTCEIATVIRNRGPLETSFAALGPILPLAQKSARTAIGRRLRRMVRGGSAFNVSTLQRWCAEQDCDAIYSNTITNGEVLGPLESLHLPTITHVHELDYWIRVSGEENLRLVRTHTDAYIAASRAVKTNLVERHSIPTEKISVVYEHIRELPALPTPESKKAARQALGIPENAFVIGGCGAEHWRKGRDLIPQLLSLLRRNSPEVNFHFTWIGRPGTPEEEYTLNHDLRCAGVADFFHPSGEVANPFTLFPAIDVFALLSREDPYPLACLEVAAMGNPVVCFENSGGMPEFVSDGCGLVAPYLDLHSMAADIARLQQDRHLRESCAARTRLKVSQENTLETTGPQLFSIIHQCVRSHRLQ